MNFWTWLTVWLAGDGKGYTTFAFGKEIFCITQSSLYHHQAVICNMQLPTVWIAYSGFHSHLFVFHFFYQFYTKMTPLFKATFWNPKELLLFILFHNLFKKFWFGWVTKNDRHILPSSILNHFEISTELIKLNNLSYHLFKF